jgi:hypothetical protein
LPSSAESLYLVVGGDLLIKFYSVCGTYNAAYMVLAEAHMLRLKP